VGLRDRRDSRDLTSPCYCVTAICVSPCLFGQLDLRSARAPSRSVAMSTNPMFKCRQCEASKPLEAFGTRQRASSHGRKGDRHDKCLSCLAVNTAYKKRRREESHDDRPVKRFATQPAVSLVQFEADLAEHAYTSKIDFNSRVSLDAGSLTDKDIANQIASIAWKATGYRFR